MLDFGLARRRKVLTPRDATGTVSVQGLITGTLAYMSPEQAKGLEVDARSDLFSVGAVLYELLTGKRAFERETATATLAAVIAQPPAKAVSGWLARVIARCLEKDPDKRYQDARELLRDLRTRRGILSTRRAAFSVGAVAFLLASVFWFGRARSVDGSHQVFRSIAVLPIENLSNDPTQEWFSDGMTETLITELSRIRSLKVISRTSVMRFKKSQRSLKDIARELGVRGGGRGISFAHCQPRTGHGSVN